MKAIFSRFKKLYTTFNINKDKICCGWKGAPKTLKQIKDKILYKIARDHNKIAGVSPKYCPYYQEFDEVLGTGDVVNTLFEKEMGC